MTEMTGATVDDQVPEIRDSHEASQDQAEDAADEKETKRAEVKPIISAAFSFSSEESEFDEETGDFADQQLIAGRVIHASFSWLNREREEVGSYKERRLARSGPTMTAAITPMVFSTKDLGFCPGKAEVLPLVYMAHQATLLVRPEHPTTARAMTYKGETANRLPLCSDLMHNWAFFTGNRISYGINQDGSFEFT